VEKREEEMKRSKKYTAAAAKINADQLYTPLAGMKLVKDTNVTKYDASVEVSMVLGVDPKKADQAVRSVVNLPHGTGKTARVLVFANGAKADEARAAGADIVGGDELIEEVNGGRLDYDAVVATPDLMGKVGRLGKVLGPRGLMPNPKTGTVTTDVAKAVTDIMAERSNSALIRIATFTSSSESHPSPQNNLQITTQRLLTKFFVPSLRHLRAVTFAKRLYQQRWDLAFHLIRTTLAKADQ